MQVVRAHDKGPQFPESWPEHVPGNIEAVLAKALDQDPEKRYTSAEAFWYALHDLDAQEEARREAARRAAVAAQWRAEAEAAFRAQEWSTAKIAVRRWLAVTPEDKAAQALQAKIAAAASASQTSAKRNSTVSTPSSSPSVSAGPIPAPSSPQHLAPQPKAQSDVPEPRQWVLVVAVIGLISGLVSCVGVFILLPVVFSLPAVVLGILGWFKAKYAKNPRAVRIMSLLGLVFGLLSLLSLCIFAGTGLLQGFFYEL
jgi:VIT1/CCC1 family predicted Fe2+/Mn2+ transporter